VATHHRENAEGEQSAREAVERGRFSFGGTGVRELWGGAKGQERIDREGNTSRALGKVNTSEAGLNAKAREGAKNQ